MAHGSQSRSPVAQGSALQVGDVVAFYSPALGEWTAVQVTHRRAGLVRIAELDWSGPEPSCVEDLGELRLLVINHHSWPAGGVNSYCEVDDVVPRGARVLGPAPLLYGFASGGKAGWPAGVQLAMQRRWDSGDHGPYPGTVTLTGQQVAAALEGPAQPQVHDLTIREFSTLDCVMLPRVFPNTSRLILVGSPGELRNACELNQFTELRDVQLGDVIGMGSRDVLDPGRLELLSFLTLYSTPKDYADETRKRWRSRRSDGTVITIRRSLSAEKIAAWLADPFRDWSAREHISAVRRRKALNIYTSTRESLLDLTRTSGADQPAAQRALGAAYAEAFNALGGTRSPFIETDEAEDIITALDTMVDHVEQETGLPLPDARHHLREGADDTRDW